MSQDWHSIKPQLAFVYLCHSRVWGYADELRVAVILEEDMIVSFLHVCEGGGLVPLFDEVLEAIEQRICCRYMAT